MTEAHMIRTPVFFTHDSPTVMTTRTGDVGWVHPELGRVDYSGVDDYHPPIVRGRAYMADGRPAVLCAGWAALGRRRVV